jgi:ATP-binding cassette subfamily B protein
VIGVGGGNVDAIRTDERSPLRRFLGRYTPPFYGAYALGILALLATNWINVLIPEQVRTVIDAIHAGHDGDDWRSVIVFMLGLAFAVIATRTLSRVLFFNPGRTVEFRLKNDYLGHLLQMGPAFFQRLGVGELLSRGTNDIMAVRSIIGYATLQLFNVTIALGMTIERMIAIDATMTWTCLAPFALGIVILRHGIRLLLVRYREAQKQLAELSDAILESYAGAPIIQSFNATAPFEERVQELNDAYVENYRKMAVIRSFHLPAVAVVGSACLAIVLLMGGSRVVEGALTLGDIAAYAAYIGIIVAALNSTGWVINSIQRGLVSLQRVYDVLDSPVDLPEAEGASGEDASDFEAITETPYLRVMNASFRHPDTDPEAPPTLANISFDVPPGSRIGVFGPTGSGKSTLLRLLARLPPPEPGMIFVNETDLVTIPDAELRRTLTLVPQRAYLFSRTVRENIALDDLPAEIDDQRVKEVVRIADLETDVEALVDGLETIVGERGVTLSGGQRQRVALARALYRPRPLILLDDVLSAVDRTTEKRLLANLGATTDDFTAIVTSHRISAIAASDLILVLDGGRIVERGTHQALIETDGIYARTWRQQLSDEAEKTDG